MIRDCRETIECKEAREGGMGGKEGWREGKQEEGRKEGRRGEGEEGGQHQVNKQRNATGRKM